MRHKVQYDHAAPIRIMSQMVHNGCRWPTVPLKSALSKHFFFGVFLPLFSYKTHVRRRRKSCHVTSFSFMTQYRGIQNLGHLIQNILIPHVCVMVNTLMSRS